MPIRRNPIASENMTFQEAYEKLVHDDDRTMDFVNGLEAEIATNRVLADSGLDQAVECFNQIKELHARQDVMQKELSLLLRENFGYETHQFGSGI